MSGPVPKPPGQRRRRNANTSLVQIPAEGNPNPAPPLTGCEDLPSWVHDTYWPTIWASPMATLWIDADVPALTRLARLMGAAMTGDASAAELSEARQIEDRFGLSMLSRRRLNLQITETAAGGQAAVPPRPRRLRAVG